MVVAAPCCGDVFSGRNWATKVRMEGKTNAALDETLNMRFIYKVIAGIFYGYLFVFVFVIFADKVMFD